MQRGRRRIEFVALSGNKLSNNNSGKSGQFRSLSLFSLLPPLLHFSSPLRILMNAIKARMSAQFQTGAQSPNGTKACCCPAGLYPAQKLAGLCCGRVVPILRKCRP